MLDSTPLNNSKFSFSVLRESNRAEEQRKRSSSLHGASTKINGNANHRHSHPNQKNIQAVALPTSRNNRQVHPSSSERAIKENLLPAGPSKNNINSAITAKKIQPQNNLGVAMRKSPHRATVTKRTRTFMVEGVEVTSTTMHVLDEKQNYELRLFTY